MSNNIGILIKATADLNAAQQQISSFLNEIDGGARKATESSGFMSRALSTAAGTMAGFVSAQAVMRGVGAVFGFAKDAVFGMNATLETSTLQFATLMGDADAAKEHVKGLFEFAKATPFETEPIIQASRMLRTFGGDALDTKDNLTLLGDASAATSAPIDQLGFWVGRMYANLKGGQPIGEATMRLTEMAVLSPEVANELKGMAEAGAGADETFGVFQESLGRFNGAMETQAGTWEGVTSTLTDSVNILVGGAFKPFFELTRDLVGSLNDVLGSDQFSQQAQRFADVVAGGVVTALDMAKQGFAFLRDAAEPILSLWDDMQSAGQALFSALGDISISGEAVGTALRGAATVMGGVWKVTMLGVEIAASLVDKLGLLKGISAVVNIALQGFGAILSGVGGTLGWVADKVRWLLESVGLLDKNIKPAQASTVALEAATKELNTAFGNTVVTAGAASAGVGEMSEAQVKAADKVLKKRDEVAKAYLDNEKRIMEFEQKWLEEQDKKANDYLKNELTIHEASVAAVKKALEEKDALGLAYLKNEQALHEESLALDKEYQQLLSESRNAAGLALMEADAKRMKGFFADTIADLPNVILATLQGGGNVGQAVGGKIFGDLFSEEGPMGKLFAKGGDKLGKLIGGNMGRKLGETFGSLAGPLGTLLGGMAGDIIGPLVSKVGGFFKGLFGVSANERDGNNIADQFRQSITAVLTEAQKLEVQTHVNAGRNQQWAESTIAIRDAYIAAGRTEQEALDVADRLWRAQREGGDAVRRVIEEITGVTGNRLTPALAAAETQAGQTTSVAITGFSTLLGEVTTFQGQIADPTAVLAFKDSMLAALADGTFNVEIFRGRWQDLRTTMQQPIRLTFDLSDMPDVDGWSDQVKSGKRSTAYNNNDHLSRSNFDSDEAWQANYLARNGNLPGGRTWADVMGSAGGGLYSKPTFRVLAETRPEMVGEPSVIAESFMRALRALPAAAMLGGAAAAGPAQIVVPIYLDGSKIDERVIDITNRGLANGSIRVGQRNITDRIGRF